MRITRFESVYQLTFFPHIFPVNCYLADEEDGLTLIDTGIPISKTGILKAADYLRKPIKRISLTMPTATMSVRLTRCTTAFPV